MAAGAAINDALEDVIGQLDGVPSLLMVYVSQQRAAVADTNWL